MRVIIIINIIIIIIIIVLRQVRSLYQNEFAAKCYLMLPLSIFNTLLGRPVAA